jgi:tetratricopeptide (TPR) repeat protein
LHARVVDAIERLYPERLAEHRARLVHHAVRAELWSKASAHLRDLGGPPSGEEIDEVMGKGPESPGKLWWAGEYDRAFKTAERDRAVGASFGNFAMQVVATCRLGQVQQTLGNYRPAADLLRQVIGSLQGDLARERLGMAAFASVWARSWLAWTLAEIGDFAEGATIAEEGMRIAVEAGHLFSRGQASFGLGTLYLTQGRAEQAIEVLERGLVLARSENIAFQIPFISGPLGVAYARAGDLPRGIALLEQTVEQAEATRLVAHHALRLAWLGEAQLHAGRRDAALELARRALALAEERRERGHVAYAACLLGEILAGAGASAAADAVGAYRQSLAQAEALGMAPLAARARRALDALSPSGAPPGSR